MISLGSDGGGRRPSAVMPNYAMLRMALTARQVIGAAIHSPVPQLRA
jgi:hypothetical protein